MDETFKFTTDSSGQITGISLVGARYDHVLRVPDGTTFTSNANKVTETISGDRATVTVIYTQDAADASIYRISSESTVIKAPSTDKHYFSFTVTGGAVTAASETFTFGTHTHTRDLTNTPASSFSASAAGVTETRVVGDLIETLNFVQVGSSGEYALASDTRTVIAQGSATTALNVEPFERDQFVFDASGNVTGVQAILWDGSTKTVTPGEHTSYTQLEKGFVLETHTGTHHTSFELFYDGNGDGKYTAIAEGNGTSVDLVGIKAQLTGIEGLL